MGRNKEEKWELCLTKNILEEFVYEKNGGMETRCLLQQEWLQIKTNEVNGPFFISLDFFSYMSHTDNHPTNVFSCDYNIFPSHFATKSTNFFIWIVTLYCPNFQCSLILLMLWLPFISDFSEKCNRFYYVVDVSP